MSDSLFNPKTGKIDVSRVAATHIQFFGTPQTADPLEAIAQYQQMLENLRGLFAHGPGRPDHSGWYADRDQFRTALLLAIAKVRQRGFFPSQERVALALIPQLTTRTLQRNLKKYHLAWQPLLHETLAT
jgi:hypothetical protein